MSTQTIASRNPMFTIGWLALLISSAFSTLNHLMLPLYGDDVGLAIGWTAFTLYATIVIYIPFRRGERWAWYTTWILVISFAIPVFFGLGGMVGVAYAIVAGVMAVGLLLTWSAFFRK